MKGTGMSIIYKGNVTRVNPRKKKSIVTINGSIINQSTGETGEFEIKGKYGQ